MLPLIFFILGMITMGYVLPCLESLASWFQQWVETKKGALVVKQMKYSQEIQESQELAYETPVVGFQVNYDDEPEEIDPEEETEPDED